MDWLETQQRDRETCIGTIDAYQYANGPFPDRPGKYWIFATGSFSKYFDGNKWEHSEYGWHGFTGYKYDGYGRRIDE